MLRGRLECVSYFSRWIGPLHIVLVFCVLRLLLLLRNHISWLNLPLCLPSSYGRVYATDPYHHTLAPAPTYGVGAMVSTTSSSSWLLPCPPPPAPVHPFPQLGSQDGLTADVLSLSLN